ncbi:hypothetical protein ACJMK2_007390 [Sinanodonta woodiana]|uniref:Cyclin-L1 n=1 Tax=Sinanodonta woodiana TaxID=1069815 RepID=A0ABD3VIE5_SINWO
MAEVNSKPTVMMIRDFSRVILTLENVLIPDEKLSTTPSLQDGLDYETEMDLRILGCELIQTAGILLKLPQVAMATGQVLFQRFYYSKSFVKHNMEVLAMACINLASKIEECPRRIRDVINVFHHIKQVRNQKNIHPLVLDQNYINLKNQVIKSERRVLKELGFCVHVQHPHKIIVMYLQVLECEQNQKLVQCAWNYMNDSFRTDVFVRYQPETIACACIFLAARQLQIALPNAPPWFYLFQVDEREIEDICITLLRLYARKRPNCDALEKKVNDARKIQIEAKLKAKGLTSEKDTPNSTSRTNSPKNVSPNPTLLAEIRRVKKEGEEKQKDKDSSDHNNHVSKNRNYDRGEARFSRSRSKSRTRSRSSRSFSRSPVAKHRKRRSPGKKNKKDRYSSDRSSYKDAHKSHKRKRQRSRSRSNSVSLSPEQYKPNRKKFYKEKERDRKKDRYYSPEHSHSRKHHNGHRSSSRDTYSDKYADKYRR